MCSPDRFGRRAGSPALGLLARGSATMSRAYWAYVFTCEQSIEAMLAALNDAGPWRWQARESAWYGDYLNVRPAEGVRLRIHEFPSSGEVSIFVGPGVVDGVAYDRGYTALLELDNAAARAEIDGIFRGLLGTIGAGNITAIDPYD